MSRALDDRSKTDRRRRVNYSPKADLAPWHVFKHSAATFLLVFGDCVCMAPLGLLRELGKALR